MEQDVTNQTGPADSGATLPDPLAEALRLVTLASARGQHVRLMGGLAFHAQCREWTAVARGRDIDLATRSKDRKAFSELMTAEGYAADRRYNALYGHKQLYFVDEARTRPIDVLVDRLEMCHTFEFMDRLTVAERHVAPRRAPPFQAPGREDQPQGRAGRARPALGASARRGDEGGRAISLKRITGLTSERLGLVAHGHRQPGKPQ